MNKKTVLLLLSALIALLDGIFVYINYRYSHETFIATVKTESDRNHVAFQVSLDQMYEDLLLVATLYAENPRIQELFLNGKQAVEFEGGGAGEKLANYWREQLFDEVGTSWLEASKQFRIRQLHFHLGPGSTSFLRVHRADKFGDNMDNVRFTIVETNKTLSQQTGFETGRVYSGLRGVVPVFANDPISGERVHVGALEAGTSFSNIIKILDDGLGASFSVLLTREHIAETMWPSAQEKVFGTMKADCRCVVEATSRPGVEDILRQIPFIDGRPQLREPYLVSQGGQTYATTFYPLRDFKGQQDPSRPNVGAILVWENITLALSDLERQQWVNALYALGAFVILEIMLFFAFKLVTRTLESTVQERTQELSTANTALAHEIETKNRFFSIIAHDLRSPFNSLLGMTRLLEQYADLNEPEKLRGYASHVHDAGEKFYLLLQGLLEWSNHQMKRDSFRMQEFCIADVVQETIDLLTPLATDKEILIQNHITEDPLWVSSDRDAVQAILRNLVSNAIKFVHPGGQIELAATPCREGFVAVSVTDNGIGVPDTDFEDLFSLDRKTTSLGTQGEPGTGLGLPLCKELSGEIGGDIKAEPIAPQGSRFTFTVPCRNFKQQKP